MGMDGVKAVVDVVSGGSELPRPVVQIATVATVKKMCVAVSWWCGSAMKAMRTVHLTASSSPVRVTDSVQSTEPSLRAETTPESTTPDSSAWGRSVEQMAMWPSATGAPHPARRGPPSSTRLRLLELLRAAVLLPRRVSSQAIRICRLPGASWFGGGLRSTGNRSDDNDSTPWWRCR